MCQLSLYYAELYDLRVVADRRELIVRVLQALGAASLVLALAYYILPTLIIGRGVFLVASLLVVVTVAGWRFAFEWLSVAVGPAERLLVVGTSNAAMELATELRGTAQGTRRRDRRLRRQRGAIRARSASRSSDASTRFRSSFATSASTASS